MAAPVAAGEPLPEWDGQLTGHAIEVRVYAEDPYSQFLPQAGRIVDLAWPRSVRVETAIREPHVVSALYDPMLAKIVVDEPDRATAIATLVSQLDRAYLAGMRTNLGFLRRIVGSSEFAKGEIHTGWLDSPAAAPR